jgi:hypothetical protein
MARVEANAAVNKVQYALDNPAGGWLRSRADPARPRSSDMLTREDQNDEGAQKMLHAGVHL